MSVRKGENAPVRRVQVVRRGDLLLRIAADSRGFAQIIVLDPRESVRTQRQFAYHQYLLQTPAKSPAVRTTVHLIIARPAEAWR